MKYELETIPIWDTYDMDTECPLCVLGEKAERRYVDFFLGSSVMAPEMRVEVNQTGFCSNHLQALFSSGLNLHGLGLLMHTHLSEQSARLAKLHREIKSESQTRKKSANYLQFINALTKTCMICDRVDYTIKRYAFTIVYLWQKQTDFKQKFTESKGFCYEHLPYILVMAEECLGRKKLSKFMGQVTDLQEMSLLRLCEEIRWFTQKFDYQNNDKPWGTSKDALHRVLQILSGVIFKDRNDR